MEEETKELSSSKTPLGRFKYFEQKFILPLFEKGQKEKDSAKESPKPDSARECEVSQLWKYGFADPMTELEAKNNSKPPNSKFPVITSKCIIFT